MFLCWYKNAAIIRLVGNSWELLVDYIGSTVPAFILREIHSIAQSSK